MKKLACFLAFASAAWLNPAPGLAAVGTPKTYSKLIWQMSTTAPGFTSCTQIYMDATGDLDNSENLILAGGMNCGSFGYAVVGAAYLGRDGTLNFTVYHGGYSTDCSRLVNFAGTCFTYDGAGVRRGSGTIRLL